MGEYARLNAMLREEEGKLESLLKALHENPHDESLVEMCVDIQQGIGGDDRCGIWTIMQIVKGGKKPYIIFCEDEEIGRVGAIKFCNSQLDLVDHLKENINYMIEIDRQGSHDAVYYSCDNKDFEKWIEEKTRYTKAIGSYSDISTFMPELGIAGVNLSCGYYNAHTTNEYVLMEEMENTIKVIDKLLDEESIQYEYIEKKYTYGSYGGSSYYNWADYYREKYGYTGLDDDDDDEEQKEINSYNSSFKQRKISDIEVELYVEMDQDAFDLYGLPLEITVTGSTKPECWMNLMFEYPEFQYALVVDYTYS